MATGVNFQIFFFFFFENWAISSFQELVSSSSAD